jgi:hypothetical protein
VGGEATRERAHRLGLRPLGAVETGRQADHDDLDLALARHRRQRGESWPRAVGTVRHGAARKPSSSDTATPIRREPTSIPIARIGSARLRDLHPDVRG